VEEEEPGESEGVPQWTTGGVRGEGRLNMAKEREEGFLEDTRWVDDVVTGDVPDKHGTSDAVECGDGCTDDSSSSSDIALLTSTTSGGITIDRDIFRGISGRIFSARWCQWIYVKPCPS
jgi:hypothetical protein